MRSLLAAVAALIATTVGAQAQLTKMTIATGVDPDIVAVADGTYLVKWLSVIGRKVADLEALKGKKIGIAMGTGSEIFWRRVLEKKNLKLTDFTMINVEAPEML